MYTKSLRQRLPRLTNAHKLQHGMPAHQLDQRRAEYAEHGEAAVYLLR